MRRRKVPKVQAVKEWVRQHWRRLIAYTGGSIAILLIFVQLLYPTGKLPLYMSVDGVSLGGWDKPAAAAKLDSEYRKRTVELHFGDAKDAYRTPKLADAGISVTNGDRLEQLSYPFWMRIIPTSLFWAHSAVKSGSPIYAYDQAKTKTYIDKELGQSCNVAPKNATLTADGSKLKVVNSVDGGTCNADQVKQQLTSVKPDLHSQAVARVPMKTIVPGVTNDTAKAFAGKLTERIGPGVSITASGQPIVADTSTVISWLDFATTDDTLSVAVSAERSADYLAKQVAPKVTRAAGVSKVTTQDFVELSRQDGPAGQTLNGDATRQNIVNFLRGDAESVAAAVSPVAPRVEYTRTYSSTDVGLSALMQQYAESHPGTFGVSLVELSGQRRRANFQDTKVFQTASTYKLFVAYSTLKRVESGTFKWSDQINGGRDLTKCFDDMIVKSDNACAEALLAKIGFTPITNEMKALGLKQTSFLGKVTETSAADLSIFNATLESGQMLSADSRNRLLSAMKRNQYRQGIPAGANGTVADKVGFLDGLLHDAAVIYGPNGPIVLTIMTDGSSWATIADLTRQIEALRAK